MKQTCPTSLVFMLLVIALLIPGCDPKEHDKDNYRPVECIDGKPSLGDQIWPVGGGDVFNTRRAMRMRRQGCVSGPSAKPSVQWSVSLPTPEYNNPPTVADDGTIYFVGVRPDTSDGLHSGVMAFTPQGVMKWFFEIHPTNPVFNPYSGKVFHEAVALGEDGTLYGEFFQWDSSYYAIRPDGTMQWRYKMNQRADRSPWWGMSHTVVGPTGDVYAATPDTVYCFAPSGKVRWRRPVTIDPYAYSVTRVSIGAKGLYIGFFRRGILALDFNGNQRWFYTTDYEDWDEAFTILVDTDENLYFKINENSLVSVDAQGQKRWQGGSGGYISNAVLDGDFLYFGIVSNLIKLHKDSNIVYRENSFGNQMWYTSAPLIDDMGRIYIVTNHGYTVCYENDEILWTMKGPDAADISIVQPPPVLTPDGGIFFVTTGGLFSDGTHLYFIK